MPQNAVASAGLQLDGAQGLASWFRPVPGRLTSHIMQIHKLYVLVQFWPQIQTDQSRMGFRSTAKN